MEGSGTVKSDFSEFEFGANAMMAFTPYQPFMISGSERAKGIVLNFHPDFFCIVKHHEAVACNGVLFNNIYQSPVLNLDEKTASRLEGAIEQLKDEMLHGDLAQYELLVSYLKIILITASRKKVDEYGDEVLEVSGDAEPFTLKNLRKHIEEHFRTKHAPSEYADLLNMTPKALGKATKKHFNKTMTDLIAERIMIEAKRELYLTDKQVKLIASELGYKDEYYFSRFFKNYAEVSPQVYRETVGFARGAA